MIQRKYGKSRLKTQQSGAALAAFERANSEAEKAHDAELADETSSLAEVAAAKQAAQESQAEQKLEAGRDMMKNGLCGMASKLFAAGKVAAENALRETLVQRLANAHAEATAAVLEEKTTALQCFKGMHNRNSNPLRCKPYASVLS